MRDRLIALLSDELYWLLTPMAISSIADYLIAAGVTMPVRCRDCKIKEHCRTTTVWANPPSDDWFCADGKRRLDNGT